MNEMIFEGIYFIFFSVVTTLIQSILELRFLGQAADIEVKKRDYLIYAGLSFAINVFEISHNAIPWALLLFMRTIILWWIGVLLLKCASAIAFLSAVVIETVMLLSAGITAPLFFFIVSVVRTLDFGRTAAGGLLFGMLGQVMTFAVMIASCRLLLKKLKWQGVLPEQYLAVFFLPIFMVLTVEQYIFNEIYGNEVIINQTVIVKPVADHGQLFLMQVFACFTLFSTLYACRRLSEAVSTRTRLLLLEQETKAQQRYLEESKARDQQTRAFRHDFKHHLLALSGYLEQGEIQEAKQYLSRLDGISDQLSVFYKTGNTVVDMVLGSKLVAARQDGISVDCTIRLPDTDCLEDLDLCVIFANAVDNAVHGCHEQKEGERYIRITGRQKGDFFLVEVENSCSFGETFQKGIGLSNIQSTVEKYQGRVTTKKKGGVFYLNVLLVISRRLNYISENPIEKFL